MNKEQTKPKAPKCTEKSICIAFGSESEYREIVVDQQKYRAYLEHALNQTPELFPQGMSAGFTLHDLRESKKQPGLLLRRIKFKASHSVYTVRPSLVMPYLIAKTDEIEKALYLRQWGVPFSAFVYVFGHDEMFWYRAWLRLGRTNLVGSTVKAVERMPVHLVADEKITWLDGAEISVPTTVGGGCILGITIAENADGTTLKQAYGEFAAESAVVFPTYQPASVCTDGWKVTRKAWRCLFPGIAPVLCYLHSVLKISQRCTGALRHTVLTKAWHVYHAPTKAAFVQRIRRLREWNQQQLSGTLASMVEKLCAHKADSLPAYDCPGALRTSNAVDRLLNHLDRQLYAMYYFHGTSSAAKLAVRTMAMQWIFIPMALVSSSAIPNGSPPFPISMALFIMKIGFTIV